MVAFNCFAVNCSECMACVRPRISSSEEQRCKIWADASAKQLLIEHLQVIHEREVEREQFLESLRESGVIK
jgi:hypothetical protein